jgi:hypothetical protein
MVSGAASAAASSVVVSLATNQKLGWNVLDSAVMGAVGGGLSWSATQVNQVTQASRAAAEARGGRSLYTSQADLGDLFTGEPTDPLNVSSDTLNKFVAGTSLEGRATIGELPDGKVGLTNPDGSVIISPKAFRSADALALVVDHEGVHVNQLVTGNFNGNSLGKNVNELEAWRSTLRYVDSRSSAPDMGLATWSYTVDQVANYFDAIDSGHGGGAYVPNVTGSVPYNYNLRIEDACPMTVCNPAGYKR